ncbi:MAG TPA: glycosyltransferase [Gaiellaceae bacterium]|nr:glycosyltransferase [Gaiellaceae bacterium]
MADPPSITVVLPTRNGAETIGRQLDALARQSYDGPWELLVVDNGSADRTLAVVDSFAGAIRELRVVNAGDTVGIPFACNVAVGEARSDAIAFCNDDDEVDEGWVAAMAAALREHELVAGKLEHERLNEPWILAVRGRPQEDGPLLWSFGGHLPFAAGASLGIRRSLHERIGGFDEALLPAGEDMDYCWRAQYAGAELRFATDAVTHYRFRHGLKEIYRQGRNYGVGNVLVYRKHLSLGMPPVAHPWRSGARAWLGIAKQGLLAANRIHRGRFLWYLGWRLGILQASLRHRVALF